MFSEAEIVDLKDLCDDPEFLEETHRFIGFYHTSKDQVGLHKFAEQDKRTREQIDDLNRALNALSPIAIRAIRDRYYYGFNHVEEPEKHKAVAECVKSIINDLKEATAFSRPRLKKEGRPRWGYREWVRDFAIENLERFDALWEDIFSLRDREGPLVRYLTILVNHTNPRLSPIQLAREIAEQRASAGNTPKSSS